MSEAVGIVVCNLCKREYKKYDKKEANKIFGIDEHRTSSWSLTIKFVDIDKSPLNRHICTYCISDILNKFGN